MLFRSSLPLFLAAMLIAGGCSVAVAGETFICERSRIVTATQDTLEMLKRTDACVAAYYGLKIEGQPAAAASANADSEAFTREVFIGVEATGAAPEAPHERLTRLNPAELEKAAKALNSQRAPRLTSKPRQIRAGVQSAPAASSDAVMPVVHIINGGS